MKLKIRLIKSKYGWSIEIGYPFKSKKKEIINGFITRNRAIELSILLQEIFKAGKLQEWKEGVKRASKIMKEFGI